MLGQLDTFIAFVVVILGVSLLITVLNQFVATLFGLRGANLRWGLETLLQQIDKHLAVDARLISEEILQHPLISDSMMSKTQSWPVVGRLLGRWRKGSAIKVSELMEILRMLAEPVPAGGATHWRHRLTRMLADQNVKKDDRLTAAASAFAKLAPALAPAGGASIVEKIDELAPQLAAQVRTAVGDVELWFDSVMDRVSQRFASQVRIVTVIFAVIVAFTLHLDAALLLDQVRSDPELRARLVAAADAMSKEADLVLGSSVSSIYRAAAQRLQAETPELKNAGSPPPLVSESDGAAWVLRNLLQVDQPRRDAIGARYEALVKEELTKLTGTLRQEANAIRMTLEGTGLQLVPNYAKHTRTDKWPDWWLFTEPEVNTGTTVWNRHFFGVLASAALLSLGAPFWFNALKTATTLKPIVATKEREERAKASGRG